MIALVWVITVAVLAFAVGLLVLPIEKPRTRVYISGRMSGLQDFGFSAFDRAAKQLREAGYEPISPADVARSFDATIENIADLLPNIMAEDLRLLTTCGMVLLLPGWEQGRGTKIERDLAVYLGIPCFTKAMILEETA